MNSSTQSAPTVVVIGAGMAGMAVVRALSTKPLTVQLIDENNYNTFPPLLFQVATCFISPAEVARPVRGMLPQEHRVTFRVGRAVHVEWADKRVLLEDGMSVPFDYLVLATGVAPAFADVPGAASRAIPLKTVPDAIRLRNGLLRSFERAAADPAKATVGDTSVVVVGGGPTGVELSGYVASLLFHEQFTADYPELDPTAMRVTLIERGSRLLPGFDLGLATYALDTLRARGVEVRLGTDVVEVDSDGVTISGGVRIPAATVIWAGGVDVAPWVKRLGLPLSHGRVVVERDLRVPGHPDTFVVGDLAAVRSSDGQPRPQVAQVAIQTGRHAGRQIVRLFEGRSTRRFAYLDKGMMAILGRNAAIVQTGPVRLTGRLAWLAWGFLHITYLPGALNRMTTGLKYLWWHLSHETANRVLIESEAEKIRQSTRRTPRSLAPPRGRMH